MADEERCEIIRHGQLTPPSLEENHHTGNARACRCGISVALIMSDMGQAELLDGFESGVDVLRNECLDVGGGHGVDRLCETKEDPRNATIATGRLQCATEHCMGKRR